MCFDRSNQTCSGFLFWSAFYGSYWFSLIAGACGFTGGFWDCRFVEFTFCFSVYKSLGFTDVRLGYGFCCSRFFRYNFRRFVRKRLLSRIIFLFSCICFCLRVFIADRSGLDVGVGHKARPHWLLDDWRLLISVARLRLFPLRALSGRRTTLQTKRQWDLKFEWSKFFSLRTGLLLAELSESDELPLPLEDEDEEDEDDELVLEPDVLPLRGCFGGILWYLKQHSSIKILHFLRFHFHWLTSKALGTRI